MGPLPKKRKLQSDAVPAAKRSKNRQLSNASRPKKATATTSKPSRRAVDAAALAWTTVDEEEYGGLQVIDDVDIIKDGNKVQFLVSGEHQLTGDTKSQAKEKGKGKKNKGQSEEKEQDEDEPFEGFGDDAVESGDIDAGEAGAAKVGLENEDAEAPADGKKQQQKKKQKKQKQAVAGDAELGQKKQNKESASLGNSFSALAGDEAEDDEGLDMAAWAALNLSPSMLSAIAKLKFSKPTKIQAKTIPEIVGGQDVIGKAQTGSGKTLAFGIPIIEKWLEAHENRQVDADGEAEHTPLALVLSPTRELAKQLGDHLQALCNGLPSSPYVCVITGGLSIQKQQRQLLKADIIIATPGRLWEVMEGDAKLQDAFTSIQFLVIDEADRLLTAGQFKEAEDIIGALDKKDPNDEESDDEEDLSPRQTLVFSATFDKGLQAKLAGRKQGKKKDGDEDKMEYLMKRLRFRNEPKFIDVNPVRQMADGLKEGLVECGAMEKDLYLYTVLLLNPKRRTLVFTNSISAVRRITPFLQNLNLNVLPLQSQMPQKARLRSLERFREASKSSILVATDVAARGLDIPEVDMVLHYHVPRAADTYVHRSGRTARGERTGVSVMLCSPEEVLPTRRLAGKVHAEASREYVIQTLPIDRKVASRLKPRADLSKKLADAALAKEKVRSDDSFMRSAAEDLGVEYDSEEMDESNMGQRGRGGGRKKKEKAASEMTKAEMGAVRAQLREALSQRVNLGVSEKYITGGRVDIAALLKEKEAGQKGLFLGGDGLGLGFEFD